MNQCEVSTFASVTNPNTIGNVAVASGAQGKSEVRKDSSVSPAGEATAGVDKCEKNIVDITNIGSE